MFAGFFNKDPQPPKATASDQALIDEFPFRNIYEAEDLAEELPYSFVATIHGQRWRVYPGSQPSRLVDTGRGRS